jgi:hypothetical protein
LPFLSAAPWWSCVRLAQLSCVGWSSWACVQCPSLISLEDWLAGWTFLARLVRFGEPVVVLPANGFMVVRQVHRLRSRHAAVPPFCTGLGVGLVACRQTAPRMAGEDVGFGAAAFAVYVLRRSWILCRQVCVVLYILYYCWRALQVQPWWIMLCFWFITVNLHSEAHKFCAIREPHELSCNKSSEARTTSTLQH